jgi:hypothetical protein
MAKNGEATLLLRIKEIGADILDRFVITFGDVVDAAKAVFSAMMETIDAFKENEDAVKSLNQAMINAGTFSAELQNEYLNMADALRKVTTFGDEQIINAQSLLQAYVGNKKVSEELVRATLDLATAKKMDLASAADLIGKTIATENNMLQRHGIVLDEATAKTDRMGAVIDGVNKKFHGQAEAAAAGLGAMERLKNSFGELLEVVGERVAPILSSMAAKLADIFDATASWAGQNSLAKKSTSELGQELFKLNEQIEKIQKGGTRNGRFFTQGNEEIAALKARYAEVAALQEKQFADEAASLANALENEKGTKLAKAQETWLAMQEQKFAQIEMENAQEGGSYEQKLQAEIAHTNKMIQNAKSFYEKKKLMEQQERNLDLMGRVKHNKEIIAAEEKKEKELIQARSGFLSQMATLQSTNNSVLATIGKAAAVAQITISTAQSAADGYKWGMAMGGPALAGVFQGLAYAAGAANIARVAGVQLAEGGIVKATQGGIPAIIGEGGRDEAVIPLENGMVPGMGGPQIHFHVGAMMGTEQEAREFARMIDQRLYQLRLSNESVSFDGIS